jgi:hypothetical protein
MSKVFHRKQFSNYLGEQRAIDDIIAQFIPDGGITPTPTPVPVTPTPTPTPSITPTRTLTPTPTPSVTSTLTPTPTKTGTPTPTPTRTPAPACDITYTELPSPTPSNTPTTTPTVTPSITPTRTPTQTPTPSVSPGPAFDPDAAAYLAAVVSAGGTTSPTISAATNTLYTSLKSAGIYSVLTAFYPTIGGTGPSHAVEGKLPGGTYTLTFNGTWSHTSAGMKPVSSSPYATTNLNPFVVYGGTKIMSMGVYTTETNLTGDRYHLGAYTDGNNFISLGGRVGSLATFNANTTTFTINSVESYGFLTLSSNGTIANMNLYRSSFSGNTSNAPEGNLPANYQFYLGALNLANSYYESSLVNQNFAFFGGYLTPAQITSFQTIVQTFQTSLGRQV